MVGTESQWIDKIWSVQRENFEAFALEVFQYQYASNAVYRAFADAIHRNPADVRKLESIPFLPIRFFKTHTVSSAVFEPQIVFESSGTTTTVNSRHLVKELSVYEQSFRNCFNMFYGDVAEWCVLGLLPSYLERTGSSLVYMVADMIKRSGHPDSGFYLNDRAALRKVLRRLEDKGQRILLIGVSFALLDLAEEEQLNLHHTIVMETGGMKGRRVEMIREELHNNLATAFGVNAIHSEYGMTELLSQAYSAGNGLFHCPPWMKILARDEEDPLLVKPTGAVSGGALNVIDLANIHSCCFIATDDACRLHPDGSFEVLGRLDNSDLRGCSLLAV